MRKEINAPPRRVSQASVRLTACYAGCGAAVEYRTNPHVLCADCRIKKRNMRAREISARQRRKRGIPEVKGLIRSCAKCGTNFELNRKAAAKLCGACRPKRIATGTKFRCEDCGSPLRRNGKRGPPLKRCAKCRSRRKAKQTAARRATAVPLGSQIKCDGCGIDIIRTGGNKRYCSGCSAERRKASHLRAYYRRAEREDDRWRMNALKSYRIKNQRLNDPKFDLDCRMSGAIRQSLRQNKGGRKWEALVGYALDDLMRHLERQFTRGMSWENRERWHIDHIIPLAQFNYSSADDPNFKAAWALTNLRPLRKRDNLSKNAKRILLL